MTISPALKTAATTLKTTINNNLKPQAIFRDKHDKNYTVIGNDTLDTHIPGDPVTAYEIHKVLLKLPPTFKPTTKWICKRFGESKDVIGPKMTRLSVFGLASHEKEIDPKTKRITMHYWAVYESPRSPQRENDGYDSNDENPHETSENQPKNHNGENDAVAPYIDHRNNYSSTKYISTTTPPPEQPYEPPPPKREKPPAEKPPKAVDDDGILNFRKLLPDKINYAINDTTLSEYLELSEDHIKWAVSNALKSWVINPVGMFISKCKQEMPPTPPPPAQPKMPVHHENKCDEREKLHDIDFAEHEFEVRKCWERIKKLCKQSGTHFYVRMESQTAMQRGATAITILNALSRIISNWDNIEDNPKAYFEAQCEIIS